MDTIFKPFEGHTDDILTLAYSPDGAFIATGSLDKTIRIWEALTGRQVGMSLAGHTNGVRAIARSPDGQRLVSGSDDGILRIWNTRTHRTVMGPLEAHRGRVVALQYSPDGALIASGGEDGLLKLWRVRVGDCIAIIKHPGAVRSVSFSRNSKHVVTACNDRLVRIYDVGQHKLVRELAGHRGRVLCVQYSPDDSLIASASDDFSIRLWDASTGDLVYKPLRGHRHIVYSISFSHDGQQLVSSSHDETIRVWHVTSGECVLGPLYGHKRPVASVSCSVDGEHFASCGERGSVRIWRTRDGALVLPQSTSECDINVINEYQMRSRGWIKTIAWFSDGKHFATAGDDNAVRIWDVQTGQESTSPLVWHCNTVNDIDISRDEELLASAGYDDLVCIWDLKSQSLALEPLSGHKSGVLAVKFIPDDTRLVTGGGDRTIRVWDVRSGASLHVIEAHSGSVRTLSISLDGSRLASGSGDKTVRIWDLHSYEALGKPLKCFESVSSVCYSPDGSQLLTGEWDGLMSIWNVSRGERVAAFDHVLDVNYVQFSADGSKILSASRQGIILWRAETGKQLHSWQYGDNVPAAAFSPDGERVVSGSENGYLRLWDLGLNTGHGDLLLPKGLANHTKSVQWGDLDFIQPEGEGPSTRNLASESGITQEGEAPGSRNLTAFTQAFQRFFGNNTNNNLQTDSRRFSHFKDGDDVEENAENVIEEIGGSSQERRVPQTVLSAERSVNIETTGVDKGKAREPRFNSPVSQSSDSLGSFMNRPAVVTNKNTMVDFFADFDTDNSANQLRHPEESSQQDAQDLERRTMTVIVIRTIAWVRERLPGRNAETDVNSCMSTSVAHNVTARARLIDAVSVLGQAMNRIARLRGSNTSRGRAREPQSYPMTTLRRHNSRRMVIISPAWANLRIFASGDTPGRRPGGNTQPIENDVEYDDTDSMISEESYSPIVDALCFCRCSRLFARRPTMPHPTRRQTGSSSAPEQTSTNQASTLRQTNTILTRNQEELASPPLQSNEPVVLQPRPARMQKEPPSAGGRAQSSSVDVQTMGSE